VVDDTSDGTMSKGSLVYGSLNTIKASPQTKIFVPSVSHSIVHHHNNNNNNKIKKKKK
jgi:hypothetical protein